MVSTCYVPSTVLGVGIKNKLTRRTLEAMVTQVLKAGSTGNYQSVARTSHGTAQVVEAFYRKGSPEKIEAKHAKCIERGRCHEIMGQARAVNQVANRGLGSAR